MRPGATDDPAAASVLLAEGVGHRDAGDPDPQPAAVRPLGVALLTSTSPGSCWIVPREVAERCCLVPSSSGARVTARAL
jgi:hypothetical protein